MIDAYSFLAIAAGIALIIVAFPLHGAVKRALQQRADQIDDFHREAIDQYSASFEEWKRLRYIERQQMIERTVVRSQPQRQRSFYQSGSRKYSKVPGCVYLLCINNEYHKIGYAKDVNRRVTDLQVASPYPIEVVHIIVTDHMPRLEDHLHALYASKRTVGEWFQLSADDVADICSIASPVTISDLNKLNT